jgi:hypothetical protein
MQYVSAIVLVLYAVLAVAQFVVAFARIALRRSGFSAVPVLVGLIGCVGFVTSPDPDIRRLWWLAFVLDWGSIPFLLECAISWTVRRREHADQQRPE